MRTFLETQLVRSLSRFIPGCQLRQQNDQFEKFATITFEDGPDPNSTPQLLDLLDEFQISAVFFLVGEKIAEFPELTREIVTRGHTVGNHTYHHLDAWKIAPRSLIKDVKLCSKIIDSLSGELPTYWRPPFGHVTGKLVEWCQRQSIQTVLWDVMLADASPLATVGSVKRSLLQKIRPGSIITFHDTANAARVTPTALREALPELLNDDWKFVKLNSKAA